MPIRLEQAADIPTIHALNREAFGSPAEANLVDALRARDEHVLSLVAEEHGDLVGHILFSRVSLTGNEDLDAMGLAPMAVTPARQRGGIGSALVRAGLEECRRRGVEAVFVVGHPELYPRFGFERASRFGIGCELDVADDVFMAVQLVGDALRGRNGTVRFHDAFRML
jgi:putative acetyltransferase